MCDSRAPDGNIKLEPECHWINTRTQRERTWLGLSASHLSAGFNSKTNICSRAMDYKTFTHTDANGAGGADARIVLVRCVAPNLI